MPETRQRASTMSEGTVPTPKEPVEVNQTTKKPALPTVFKWDGGGKQVYISGTFSNWKTLPMVRSHGDFVTIIDLPEGDHEYKFCVDGEWKHDPKLVGSYSLIIPRRLRLNFLFAEKHRQRHGKQEQPGVCASVRL